MSGNGDMLKPPLWYPPLTFKAQCADLGKVVIVDVCIDSEEPSKDRLDCSLEIVRKGNA